MPWPAPLSLFDCFVSASHPFENFDPKAEGLSPAIRLKPWTHLELVGCDFSETVDHIIVVEPGPFLTAIVTYALRVVLKVQAYPHSLCLSIA